MAKKAAGIDRMASGLYRSRFTVEGKRYSVYGATVAECRQKESEKRSQIAAGLNESGKNISVSKYFDRWIENKQGTISGATERRYKMIFNGASAVKMDSIGNTFGAMKLVKVEVQDIRDVQNTLKDTYSTRTNNDVLNLLKSVFKTAVDERLLTWNPAAPVKTLKRTEEQARDNIHRALTISETQLFLDTAKNEWYYPLYVFLLNTGLRIGEAGSLTVRDVVNNEIHVSRTVTRDEVGGYIIADRTKTAAGTRTVPLNSDASKMWHRQQAINRDFFNMISLDKPVFCSPRGGILKPYDVDVAIARTCKKAGIDRITAHAFRATFATRCVEGKMEIKSLQEILGHTDVSMTLGLYSHGNEERKIEQLKAVNFS